MSVVLFIHSWVRWLIILVAVAALVKNAVGLIQKSEYDKMTGGMMAGFSGLFDLQVLLGLILLILGWASFSAAAGGFPVPQVEHLGTMFVAAMVAHSPRFWKDKPAAVQYRNNLIVIVVTLLLVALGVSLLVGNRWVFRGL